MTTVSVVIPSFNQAQFIAETIASVKNQSGVSFEILVMDGGSTDGTISVLQRFGDLVKWESRNDRGVFEALNRGFAVASGEIIGWLNSDDVYFHTEVLKNVTEEFNRHPEVDVLYGDVAVIGLDSTLLRIRLLPIYDRERLERSNIIAQPAAFMRRRVVAKEKLRPFLTLDYELWIRLGRKGYRFRHIPSVLAGDRQYPSRISIRRRGEMEAEFREYKSEYGIPVDTHPVRKAMDRLGLAPLRLKGLLKVLSLSLCQSGHHQLAFPMKIDSLPKLLGRQIFKSVLTVGLDVDDIRDRNEGSPRGDR